MKNRTEVLECDVSGAVVDLVENVVDLHLSGVAAGPPHGREEGALGDLPVTRPVKTVEGRPGRNI